MQSSKQEENESSNSQMHESNTPDLEEIINSSIQDIFLIEHKPKQNQNTSKSKQTHIDNLNSLSTYSSSIDYSDNSNFSENSYDDTADSNFIYSQSTSEKEIIPIKLDISDYSETYTMKNPDHRFRTFSEIVLVEHHPNYLRNISDFQFIKEIGKGAYGSVWLADDMRTGTVCAVKELHVEELKGRVLRSFLREIHTMILVQNRFICPIIGYTIEPPYSIITKYMPGGNLYRAVHNLDKSKDRFNQEIYGTHLTIICLCIAHAIRHIHRCGVIHRDIKAANVLLDKEGMPYLMDFGVSRLLTPENRYTQYIGTVSHMAPEVIRSNDYGTKADVFSYAILLYEVGEKRHAYHNASKEPQIVTKKILRGERPFFSSETVPMAMKMLITQCWSPNPQDRPSFEEIFDTFCQGKTYFKGADPKKIVNFAQHLIQEDEMMKNIPRPLPPPTVSTSTVIRRLKRKLMQKGPLKKDLVEQQTKLKEEAAENIIEKIFQKPTVFENILNSTKLKPPTEASIKKHYKDKHGDSNNLPLFINEQKDDEITHNPLDPQFMDYIDFQFKKLTPSQFHFIVPFIMPVLINPCPVTKELLIKLKQLAERNNDFLEEFKQNHLISSVLLTNDDVPYENELLEILAIFFIKRPSYLCQTHLRLLAYFITKRPEDSIYLFSKYVENIETVNDPFLLLDFLLSYARVYINIPSGSMFIDLFYYLTSEFEEFKMSRLINLKPIFTAFIQSEDKNVACTAMKAVCNLYNDSFKLNLKTLIQYLHLLSNEPYTISKELTINEQLGLNSLKLIERMDKYPCSKLFAHEVVCSMYKFPKEAINILLKFSAQSEECATILATKVTLWMDPSTSRRESKVFNLFLSVFRYPNLRNLIIHTDEFPQLMAALAAMHIKTIAESLALIFKRISLTPQLVDNLDKAGFYKELAMSADDLNQKTHRKISFEAEEADDGIDKSEIVRKRKRRNTMCETKHHSYNASISHNDSQDESSELVLNLRAFPVAAMLIIEQSARVKFLPSYRFFIPMILNQLPLQNEMTAAAIHTLTVLSFHPEMNQILRVPFLINYFTRLKKIDAQKKHAVTFLNNVSKKEGKD